MKYSIILISFCGLLLLISCTSHPRYKSIPQRKEKVDVTDKTSYAFRYEEGIASYYADKFHGRTTSNGEIYNMYDLTAAHKTLPFNTNVRVTNLENGRSVVVRINDRGPFVKGRIIDISLKAAQKLEMVEKGTAKVKLEILSD